MTKNRTSLITAVVVAAATGWCAAQPLQAAGAAATDATAELLPPRFHVTEGIRARFLELLERAPAFRTQCRRIADAEVRVVVEVGAAWDFDTGTRARSVIVRDEQRRVRFVRVLVRVDAPMTVVLPHELEHVLEQIEGLDLAAAARRRDGSTWRAGAGAYETARATTAGLRIDREYHEGAPVTTLATTSPESPGEPTAPVRRR